ncbi:MAG: GTPase HflX [Deltaproteobacteria bacterium]|nr:GTPase HflX [Deltaproteobacteria bacterium]
MKTLLVGVDLTGKKFSAERDNYEETYHLCLAENLEVVKTIRQKRSTIDPKTVVGSGKLKEIVKLVESENIDLVVFDYPLKPAQWKEITRLIPVKVIDKAMLILDIFARRAQSAEGKLKVELAQLEYNLPRLTELDSGLSRLVGGIGGRGPGETKLEISRRRSRERINLLKKKLEEIEKHRDLITKKQRTNKIPVVSIVGYTNVGKSALFNAITSKRDALVQNKLFATLDPLRRRITVVDENNKHWSYIISDTVGFIRDLPEQLYEAFKATIKEVVESDLILIVIDASDVNAYQKFQNVMKILKDLGVDLAYTLIVLNKMDIARPEVVQEFELLNPIKVSATSRHNISLLKNVIAKKLFADRRSIDTHHPKTI